jgi:hypothetical protein
MSPESGPTLVVFLGSLGDSPIERQVGAARLAATLDSIETALESGAVTGAVLVTDNAYESVDVPGLALDVDAGEFHFGCRLAEVVRRRGLNSVIYFGGGSVPLLGAEDFAAISAALQTGATVTNNQYSSDLVAFNAGESALSMLCKVTRDNSLARALAERAGATLTELPRRVETLFDIDGPTDLVALGLAGLGGPRLRASVACLELDTSAYRRLLPIFLDKTKQLIVAGRVGSHAWRYLETETACRVRLFAEERGMEADRRAETGSARSLLGFHLQAMGVGRFFEDLGQLGDAALIDSRVLIAHAGKTPSREDRFLSDAGLSTKVSDPFLRELTGGAVQAPLPVVLGGHSLMSGTLMLLNEHAWRLRDLGAI